jgi:hypothetical protein
MHTLLILQDNYVFLILAWKFGTSLDPIIKSVLYELLPARQRRGGRRLIGTLKRSGRCWLIFCMIGEAEWAGFCDQYGALFTTGKQSDLSFSIEKVK